MDRRNFLRTGSLAMLGSLAKYNQQLSAVEKEKKWDKILNIRYWYLVFYIY